MMDQKAFCAMAHELGFAEAGFCSIRGFEREKNMVARQAALNERKQLRFEPEQLYPQAQSLAVLLWPYRQAAWKPEDTLFIDSYYQDSNAAYHAANELEKRVTEGGVFAKANVSFPAKAAAVRAGLGIIGKNSLLITQKYGSRVVIILIALGIPSLKDDASVPPEPACLNCGRCMAACPVQALDEYGMSYPERCLRNYMMEGIVAPKNVRSKIGNRLLGCDICQRVCPMQPKQPDAESGTFHLGDFVTEDAALFARSKDMLSQQIGRNAARSQRIRAQAALIAGHIKDPVYLPVLKQWAQSDFEAVSAHARWAIEQIERRET